VHICEHTEKGSFIVISGTLLTDTHALHSRERASRTALAAPLTSSGTFGLAVLSDFGTYLRFVRERVHLSPADVVEACTSYGLTLSRVAYGRLERGRRAPRFAELLPLYQALSALCGPFASEERLSFVLLARRKIEGLQKCHQAITGEQWRTLAEALAHFESMGEQACSPQQHHTEGTQPSASSALLERLTQSVHLLPEALQEVVLAELRTVVEAVASQPALSLLAAYAPPNDREVLHVSHV
jgi:transcriptional regulator with XRE-family HTH domain